MKIKFYIALFLSTLVINFSIAQTSTNTKIEAGLAEFLASPSLKNGIASFHLIDKNSGQAILEKNSAIGLPTASTLKVITSITALDLLGENYTYKTKLYYAGVIDSLGTLHGDIIIQGSGDPTFGSERYASTKPEIILENCFQAIKNAGITCIEGRIIADDRIYNGNDIPGGWIWTDMGNYYGAGVSALNWKENKAGINFQTGTINNPAPIASINADLSYLKFVNNVKIGNKGTGDNVYAFSAPYSNKIVLRGTYGQDLNKTIEISIPDPAYDFAFQLKNSLAEKGIATTKEVTTGQLLVETDSIFPKNSKELYVHESPKLTEIIYWFNQKSINLYGEALLKSIGKISGDKTTTASSAEFLQKYWQQKLKILPSELDVIDGSGLSPQNHVTAQAMNNIMQYATQRPWYGSFLKALPTYNGMTMKSGTIGGTLGYTGFHKAANGKEYTYTLLVYNYGGSAGKMREAMFKFLNYLK